MKSILKKYRVRIRNAILGVVILSLLLITFFVIYGYFIRIKDNFFPTERSELGQFGDYFGGALNPVFGFASFLALLVTIIYQAKELKLSRTELELSRVELSNSAIALTNQNKAIELQSFEQTFFSWLNTYRSTLSSIEDRGGVNDVTLSGRPQLFNWWEGRFDYWELYSFIRRAEDIDVLNFPRSLFNKAQSLVPNENNIKQFLLESASDYRQDFTRIILYKWGKLYKEKEYQLDSFFRILYRLLVWIDSQHSNRLSSSQKWLYISIIRSQLSWVEMAYLYMNGLTKVGEKFKPIAEKYALFDNLTFDSNISLQILKIYLLEPDGYSVEAYSSEIAREKIGLPKLAEDTMALASVTF